jgi:hypothetical protein
MRVGSGDTSTSSLITPEPVRMAKAIRAKAGGFTVLPPRAETSELVTGT